MTEYHPYPRPERSGGIAFIIISQYLKRGSFSINSFEKEN